jgi:hypothetical protein
VGERLVREMVLNGRHCVPLMVFKVTMFIQVRDRLASGKKFSAATVPRLPNGCN